MRPPNAVASVPRPEPGRITLGYPFAPESTQDRVTRFRAWMSRSGRTAAVIGVLLIARGLITLR